MIAYERGPLKIFERLRSAAGVLHYDNGEVDNDLADGELQHLLICVWCLSPWIAGLWLIGYVYAPAPTTIISMILSLSAGAIALEKWNHG
jgi:hypothetical protein